MPAAGALVTLPGVFHAGHVEASLGRLAAELATAASSIAFWLAVEELRNSTGRFDANEVERARQFRTAQVATGATALALMVAGATHALATFREESEIRKQRVGPSISPGPGPTLNLSLPW